MTTPPLAYAVTVALVLACAAPAFASPAHAQGAHSGHGAPAPGGQSAASEAYMKAMTAMDTAMKGMAMTGDPDKDFVMMMKPHHQAAVDMAQAYLKYGKDPVLTKMANDIIASQNEEIAAMDKWMKEKGGK